MSDSTDAWYVYVLLSACESRTYVGISTDPRRRLDEHNGEAPGGAKSTRGGRPWQLARVYGPFEGRGPATSIEIALKRKRGRARLDGPWPRCEP